jgi:eukaryotic translation initiation factor 2C
LITVQGRVLDPPRLLYKDSRNSAKRIITTAGSWNLHGNVFSKKGARIQAWSWCHINPVQEGQAKDAVKQFAAKLIECGVDMNRFPVNPAGDIVLGDESTLGQNLGAFLKKCESYRVQFALVIIPDESTVTYSTIKILGDTRYGLHTSCVVESKFLQKQPQYFANVALKWNLKMGGTNHTLEDDGLVAILKEGTTMIIGYDVTHPTHMSSRGGNSTLPSLVGLVASVDRDMGQWPAVVWEQTSRQEMLGDILKEAVMSRLVLWASKNGGNLPKYIVIYRDGISEGQYRQVLDLELPYVRAACEEKYPPALQPKIAVIVSVKRHHTRFYPTDERNMGRSGNVESGTVVDRGVTQARVWDFFLVAHTAIKGTWFSALLPGTR